MLSCGYAVSGKRPHNAWEVHGGRIWARSDIFFRVSRPACPDCYSNTINNYY